MNTFFHEFRSIYKISNKLVLKVNGFLYDFNGITARHDGKHVMRTYLLGTGGTFVE
jgi:hypothetical protein